VGTVVESVEATAERAGSVEAAEERAESVEETARGAIFIFFFLLSVLFSCLSSCL
jgi:hypothetical protein